MPILLTSKMLAPLHRPTVLVFGSSKTEKLSPSVGELGIGRSLDRKSFDKRSPKCAPVLVVRPGVLKVGNVEKSMA